MAMTGWFVSLDCRTQVWPELCFDFPVKGCPRVIPDCPSSSTVGDLLQASLSLAQGSQCHTYCTVLFYLCVHVASTFPTTFASISPYEYIVRCEFFKRDTH